MLGLYRDNGKENGNYYNGLYRVYRVILGLYWDNGKNGNYCIIIGYIMGLYYQTVPVAKLTASAQQREMSIACVFSARRQAPTARCGHTFSEMIASAFNIDDWSKSVYICKHILNMNTQQEFLE